MTRLRFIRIWSVALATSISGGVVAAPPDPPVHFHPEGATAAVCPLTVDVPAVRVERGADGFASVRVSGFEGVAGRAGQPDLPERTFLVAIPFGATPHLLVDSVADDVVPGVVPRPVPAAGSAAAVAADSAIYDGARPFPESVAWLGSTGVLRDQAYVAVHVAPVRFDPTIRGLRAARKIALRVTFAGGATTASASAPRDPRFEALYRRNVVNYAQGLGFRKSALPLADERAIVTGASPTAPLTATASEKAPTTQASAPLYKILVRANGVVRLDATRLNGTGFLSQPISTWKLTSGGIEIPLDVQDTNGNDMLDAGQNPPEWVQFYGQALDFEPKTILNHVLSGPANIYEARDFTDQNVYVLTTESGTRARMTAQSAAPTGIPTPPTDWGAVAHAEVDDAFLPLGAADPWYWNPGQSNPASGSVVPSRTVSVDLPGLASSSAAAEVVVRLRGQSEDASTYPDHHSRITLENSSNQTLATNDDDGTFDGRTIYTHDFTWPGGSPGLSNPAKVTIDALTVSGAPPTYKNQLILDWIDIHYRRTFQATGDTLTFDWPDGDAEIEVSGLTSPSPVVYEVTSTFSGSGLRDPKRWTAPSVTDTGGGTYKARFHIANDPNLPDGTLRRFVVAGDGGVTIPADPDFIADTVSDLKNTTNQADLIVIADPTVLGAASQATLNQIFTEKAARGITSKLAWIGDVQDEFNYGLPGPDAIHNFLQWVMSTAPGEGWASPKPSFVMLVGDGSYDYKDVIAPKSNYIPTKILLLDDPQFGYYASDTLLAAVVGPDDIPDLAIGRVTARSDSEANGVLQKILNYEQSPPAGAWSHHAVFISDRGKNYDPFEATQEFEATNNAAIATMKIPPYSERRMQYWSDAAYCGGVASGCTATKANDLRADIKAAINGTDGFSDGAAMVQYAGHGNFNVWSDDAFFAENWSGLFDVNDLTNGTAGARYPWLIAHNCLTGGFETTVAQTLGKDFLKKPDGGAIAVFAPTGLSTTYVGSDASATIWNDVFGPHKDRDIALPILDVVTNTCISGDVQPCQSFALLGDPSLKLVLPDIAPATSPAAAGGNAIVNLSWTASTTPSVTYDVYRALGSATGTYSKINGSPVSATAYADTAVVNAKTYYYYVVAVDPQGFESRWSNFNSDCGAGDLDCVTATPLNPNPPQQPTGVTVTDPETGGKLDVSWTPNSETDLQNYTVKWGTSSGVYTNQGNAAKNTTFTITNLVDEVLYYVVVTATNTSGKTSPDSAEQTGKPTLVQGLESPQFITSLHIDKSGADAVLTWNAVTTNIYDKPTTIANYEVYRGTTPDFVPSLANRIGTPTSATFTDPGALSFANPSYYYLVRAIDTAGLAGGLGNQLPDGTDALAMSKTPDGMGGYTLTLSWPAITLDFDKAFPVVIDHYEVYGTDHPFTRADVLNGLVPLLASPTSPSWSVTAPASSQYYSVIAVDARGNKSPY